MKFEVEGATVEIIEGDKAVITISIAKPLRESKSKKSHTYASTGRFPKMLGEGPWGITLNFFKMKDR